MATTAVQHGVAIHLHRYVPKWDCFLQSIQMMQCDLRFLKGGFSSWQKRQPSLKLKIKKGH